MALTSGPATDELIASAARRFRSGLEAVAPETWTSVTIDVFPNGSCGHVAEMLGRYLRQGLGIEAEYVLKDLFNQDGSWRSGHAWLEHGGLIIDITGDQFGWPPVIVTRDSVPHGQAQDNARYALTRDATWWGIYCAPVYAEALRCIEDGGL